MLLLVNDELIIHTTLNEMLKSERQRRIEFPIDYQSPIFHQIKIEQTAMENYYHIFDVVLVIVNVVIYYLHCT